MQPSAGYGTVNQEDISLVSRVRTTAGTRRKNS